MLRGSPHLLASLLLVLACGREPARPPAEAAPAHDRDERRARATGTVAGTVRYLGSDPDRPVVMDEPLCRGLSPEPVDSGSIERGPENGLANVLVYVDWRSGDGARLSAGPAPTEPVTFGHRSCLIVPRVASARVGQPVRVVNRDPTLHSIRLRADDNADVARDLPFRGQELEVTFDRPEVAVALRCGVHPWARAWLALLPHGHAAVTGTDGSFELGGLPSGTFTIELWHELLGAERHTVKVGRGRTERLDVTFE